MSEGSDVTPEAMYEVPGSRLRELRNAETEVKRLRGMLARAHDHIAELGGGGSDVGDVRSEALRGIASGEYRCGECGVEYTVGYQGPCQEPAPGAIWKGERWSRMCPGTVSPADTARWALRSDMTAPPSGQ